MKTKVEIMQAIALADDAKTAKMDWPRLESVLVAILSREDYMAETQVQLCKEALNAFTKRGHFQLP